MRTIRLLLPVALLFAPRLPGQHPIRLKTGVIDTRGNHIDPRSLSEPRSLREGRHWLVQFRSYPGPSLRAELDRRGMRVLEYVPDFALLVSAAGPLDLSDLDVDWAGRLPGSAKISPQVADYQEFVAAFHADADMTKGRDTARTAGFEVVEQQGMLPNHLLISGPPERLAALAADDDVAYIFPAPRELRLRVPVYVCPGPIAEAGPVGDYVLEGPGWPTDSSGKVALGYFFDSFPGKLDPTAVADEIARAFAEWQRYANITFTPAQKENITRGVDILFATGDHGDEYPFTSPTMLAHTFYPAPPNQETIAGDMHLNSAVNWNIGSDIDVFSVALHEIGHALGLGHSDIPSAVMYAYYQRATGLTSDDIAAIQALYGAPSSAAPTSPAPPTAPTPTPTPTPNPTPSPTPGAGSGSDTTPPTLTILSPEGTIASAYSNSIVVSGTASDNVGVTDVEWSNSTGGSGKAAGTTTWSATVPLLVGDNVITLKAYDAAGNSAWRAVTVVRH